MLRFCNTSHSLEWKNCFAHHLSTFIICCTLPRNDAACWLNMTDKIINYTNRLQRQVQTSSSSLPLPITKVHKVCNSISTMKGIYSKCPLMAALGCISETLLGKMCPNLITAYWLLFLWYIFCHNKGIELGKIL